MKNRLTCNMFGGKDGEALNALMSAFEQCAENDGKSIYGWLDKIPKTSMVVELNDALERLGYKIIKNSSSEREANEET